MSNFKHCKHCSFGNKIEALKARSFLLGKKSAQSAKGWSFWLTNCWTLSAFLCIFFQFCHFSFGSFHVWHSNESKEFQFLWLYSLSFLYFFLYFFYWAFVELLYFCVVNKAKWGKWERQERHLHMILFLDNKILRI